MFYMANTNPAFSEIGISVILGGFGLFMLGIKMLGDGFKEAAGPKIRDYAIINGRYCYFNFFGSSWIDVT